MLAEGLPRSLRKAVNKNRVPNDIGPDLLFLASLLDPLVEKIKAMAPDLPAKAQKAREQIKPAAEKAYKVCCPPLCRTIMAYKDEDEGALCDAALDSGLPWGSG